MNRGSILSLPTDRGIEQYNKSCNWIELPKYFQPYNQEHASSRDEYVLVNLSILCFFYHPEASLSLFNNVCLYERDMWISVIWASIRSSI